ncbi:MAG: hypothetical protein IJG13_08680, partial [Kiritimatiellae bacterium]|nr:hypothetical protein [Kiritimatiellia bacterium]
GGFMMTFDGLQCPCEGGSGDDPAGEGDGYGEDDGPYVGGASATFSKSAVIFEDGCWNTPGNWVARQSTVTELNCVAHVPLHSLSSQICCRHCMMSALILADDGMNAVKTALQGGRCADCERQGLHATP